MLRFFQLVEAMHHVEVACVHSGVVILVRYVIGDVPLLLLL